MISVIIPVYNVESYLAQCLDSVLSQDCGELEVILVNDGSTDGSPAICEQYRAAHPATIVVLTKPNGGLSDARNAGTAIAKGDWIFYLDSDDWLEPGALRALLEYATLHNCDAVQGGIYYAYSNHLLYRNPNVGDQVLTRDQVMAALARQDVVKNFAWGKLYKASLARQFQFPVGKFYEDSYWQYKVLSRVNRYGVVIRPMVYYRQREDSISGSSTLRMLDLLRGQEEMMCYYSEHFPQHLPAMAQSWWNNMLLLRRLLPGNPEVEKYYREATRQHEPMLGSALRQIGSYRFKDCRMLLRACNFLSRGKGYLNRKLAKNAEFITRPYTS